MFNPRSRCSTTCRNPLQASAGQSQNRSYGSIWFLLFRGQSSLPVLAVELQKSCDLLQVFNLSPFACLRRRKKSPSKHFFCCRTPKWWPSSTWLQCPALFTRWSCPLQFITAMMPSFHHHNLIAFLKIVHLFILNVIHRSLPRGLWDFLETVFISLGKQGEWWNWDSDKKEAAIFLFIKEARILKGNCRQSQKRQWRQIILALLLSQDSCSSQYTIKSRQGDNLSQEFT